MFFDVVPLVVTVGCCFVVDFVDVDVVVEVVMADDVVTADEAQLVTSYHSESMKECHNNYCLCVVCVEGGWQPKTLAPLLYDSRTFTLISKLETTTIEGFFCDLLCVGWGVVVVSDIIECLFLKHLKVKIQKKEKETERILLLLLLFPKKIYRKF